MGAARRWPRTTAAGLIVIFVAMASRDLLGAIATASIAHGQALHAGLFDAACDIAAVLSLGETALMTARSGLSWRSIAAFGSLAAASILGTMGGVYLAGALR